jgi:hypothetical protein
VLYGWSQQAGAFYCFWVIPNEISSCFPAGTMHQGKLSMKSRFSAYDSQVKAII